MLLQRTQIVGGFIALATLLLYTWYHTGALLANFIADKWVGYVAAVGIELAVVILSLSIGQARRTGQATGFFYFVLVSTAAVSVIANVSEGFRADRGVGLTVDTWQKLDPLQWVIALAATGLISLIVLALSEIVGAGVQNDGQAVTVTKATVTASVSVQDSPGQVSETDQPNTVTVDSIDRKQAALIWLSGHPDADEDALVRAFNVSPRTARRYLSEHRDRLAAVAVNGNGHPTSNRAGGSQ